MSDLQRYPVCFPYNSVRLSFLGCRCESNANATLQEGFKLDIYRYIQLCVKSGEIYIFYFLFIYSQQSKSSAQNFLKSLILGTKLDEFIKDIPKIKIVRLRFFNTSKHRFLTPHVPITF